VDGDEVGDLHIVCERKGSYFRLGGIDWRGRAVAGPDVGVRVVAVVSSVYAMLVWNVDFVGGALVFG